MLRATALALAGALAACGTNTVVPDPGLEGLDLSAVAPEIVLPGTRVVVRGRSFVEPAWGASRLRLVGRYDDGGAVVDVDVSAPARFVDYDRMEVDVDLALLDRFGDRNGEFRGTAAIEIDSAVDGHTYATRSLPVTLDLRRAITPELGEVTTDQLIFVNDRIRVEGSGFLLGAGEGKTVALLEGCFAPAGGGACGEVAVTEVELVPEGEFDRGRGRFAFAPGIAGIEPGTFEGALRLQNRLSTGEVRQSGSLPVRYELTEPAVFAVDPPVASLGQYVDIVGGGFLGGDGGGTTIVELRGSFTPTGGDPVPVEGLFLVPEFVEGRVVRYVLNEDDALGQVVDLRRVTGTFVGVLQPVTEYAGVEVIGSSATFELGVAPVKQVVHLIFKSSYVESLRHFGLRAADHRIRERIVEVLERDYATINLEVRLEAPADFALYSTVEIAGRDPNGLGLLGYDNTPGKDTGNKRLHDKIGGVNAQTQEDGFPGYGGVFIESLFAFSEHPGPYAAKIAGADPAFDDVFDRFRPDRRGDPVTGAELSDGAVPTLARGDGCPAASADRAGGIACAIWVLGNLVGTTLSHEIGHSLGLANPYGEGFHNPSDAPDRLMDAGAYRPFDERAELFGKGPARFCTTEYDYLRLILPTSLPADSSPRPSCF